MDYHSDPQRRHFTQLSVNWGAYPPAVHLFFQPLNGYASRGLVAAQLVEFAHKLLDVGLSLVGPGEVLSFQTHYAVV